MADGIFFNSININTQESNGLIQIGENSATGWDTHNKNQLINGFIFTAFGAVNLIPNNYNLLLDNDVVDTPIFDQDVESIDKSNVG
jgi:hypothetical protein